MRDEVAMTFDHVQDLDHILPVSKEDHVASVRKAANIVTDFRARLSQYSRQAGQLDALLAKPAGEMSAIRRLLLTSAI